MFRKWLSLALHLAVVAVATCNALTCQAADVVYLKSGQSLRGTIIRESAKNVIVRLESHTTMTFEKERIERIEKVEKASSQPPQAISGSVKSELGPAAAPLVGRLPSWEHCLDVAAGEAWSHDLKAIPAIVIHKGVMRSVPYMSYSAGEYEINIYGDPRTPAGVEIGIHGRLLGKKEPESDCLSFIEKILVRGDDKKVIREFGHRAGLQKHEGLAFEITPPTADDAFGGWWVSIYDEAALDKARASEKELGEITQHVAEVSKTRIDEISHHEPGWSGEDIASTRRLVIVPPTPKPTPKKKAKPEPEPEPTPPPTPTYSSGSSGGSVYVRGYYRKDGTYVRPHSRKK